MPPVLKTSMLCRLAKSKITDFVAHRCQQRVSPVVGDQFPTRSLGNHSGSAPAADSLLGLVVVHSDELAALLGLRTEQVEEITSRGR
jgi:hypothetical protein